MKREDCLSESVRHLVVCFIDERLASYKYAVFYNIGIFYITLACVSSENMHVIIYVHVTGRSAAFSQQIYRIYQMLRI